MKISSKLISASVNDTIAEFVTDGPIIRIMFLSDRIIRIRASFDGTFPEESYVLAMTGWADRFDNFLAEERVRVPLKQIRQMNEKNQIILSLSSTCVKIDTDPFRISAFYNNEMLYSDIPGYGYVLDRNSRRTNYNQVHRDDAFYGLGEKSGPLNKNGMYLRMGGMDAMAWDPVHTDPLYKFIPFYIRLKSDTCSTIGIYYNNTYECSFSFNSEIGSLSRSYTRYQTDGGDIDMFLFLGNMREILDDYTLLTGRPVFLPKRALGYQASGMFYCDLDQNCSKAMENFVLTAKEKDFSLDGFYLSSGYTAQKNNHRSIFTWNRKRYPDPEAMVTKMNALGAPVIPNVKPGVLLDHPRFNEFLNEGVFIQNSNDDGPQIGNWWGGDGCFWDFTSKRGREAWKRHLQKDLLDYGIRDIWNDNCEADGIKDSDSICDFDGKKTSVSEVRAVLPNLMNKVSRLAIEEYDENIRPYILSRGGFAGIQRYAQTWCGDTSTSWEGLKYNIATLLGMSLSGVANNGCDIGGFTGENTDSELFVRWIQNGIFHPRFCIHSAKKDLTITEPWMYKETEDIIRQAFYLRYSLTPYLYSLEYKASVSGEPIMRPCIYDFQYDKACRDIFDSYMLGSAILCAPVVEKAAQHRIVYFPAGKDWYEWNTFCRYEGGQTTDIPVSISSIPMFIASGSVIPVAENRIMNMERDPVTNLRLIIVPSKDNSVIKSEIYDDDGRSNDYKKGIYRKTDVTVVCSDQVLISLESTGDWKCSIQQMEIELVSIQGAPFRISLRGQNLSRFLQYREYKSCIRGWIYDNDRRSVKIKIDDPGFDFKLNVSYVPENILGI